MNRRTLLSVGAAGVTTSLAGCSGGEGSGSSVGGEDIDSSAEELVFSLNDFEGTGWSRADEEIDGNMARREFRNQNDGTQIYATVWYYESVSEAENKYQELNDEATGTFRTESRDVGTEAFVYESVGAEVVFREVNVVAQVEHYRLETSQSIETATEYANRLRNQWRS